MVGSSAFSRTFSPTRNPVLLATDSLSVLDRVAVASHRNDVAVAYSVVEEESQRFVHVEARCNSRRRDGVIVDHRQQ